MVRRRFVVGMAVACSLSVEPIVARAGTFADDFESYTPGTFPSANRLDASLIDPRGDSPPPVPSTTVGTTLDAFGQPTQALHLDASWIGGSSGIYRSAPTAQQYSVSMDVRTDVFAKNSESEILDWPWTVAVGKFSDIVYPGAWNSLQVYGSALGQDFRAYAIRADGIEEDLPLGLALALEVWYHLQIDFDAPEGSIRTRVWDIASNTLLLDATAQATDWLPGDGVFDALTINQGELTATTSGDAWVDNVSITALPEPSALAVVLLGGLLGGTAGGLFRR